MNEISDRLREAREQAGFKTATEAAEHFRWKYPTYAGHENGNRSPRQSDILKYARAFRVDPAWLQFGRPRPQAGSASATETSGFAETIPAFTPPTDSLRLDLERLGRTLAPTARHTTFLTVPRNYPGLSLLKGDVIVVDLDQLQPEPGSVVVCQHVDQDTGEGGTWLRLQTKAGPVAPFCETQLPPSETESVMGTVITCLRGIPGTHIG